MPPILAAAAEKPATSKSEPPERWVDAELLPCRVSAEIEIPRFTVRDLFNLEVNSVIDSKWMQNADVPLKANGHIIAWIEFEVIRDMLAVRLTDIY